MTCDAKARPVVANSGEIWVIVPAASVWNKNRNGRTPTGSMAGEADAAASLAASIANLAASTSFCRASCRLIAVPSRYS